MTATRTAAVTAQLARAYRGPGWLITLSAIDPDTGRRLVVREWPRVPSPAELDGGLAACELLRLGELKLTGRKAPAPF